MRAMLVLAVLAQVAHADDAGALVARGDALGRNAEYSRAIELFKQADALRPSAANACRIGLAYTRRELWSQAEIFFARCKARATAADPLPDWFATATEQLAQKLAEVDAAAIDVRIAPTLALARVGISSFPPDETFEPQLIHLAPGTYTITASAPDREPARVTFAVVPRTAQIVTLVLAARPPPPTAAARAGTYLLYGAAAAAVAGVAFHALASHERDELAAAEADDDPVAWERHSGPFERDRAVAIGGYSVAVAAVIASLVLRHHHGREVPSVSATTASGGAAVWLRWER
jgi:tetratricopeptide (TPR) repeat protein